MPVRTLSSLQEVDGVGQSGQDRFQVLAYSFGASWQVHDERLATYAGHRSREHGVRRDLEARRTHCLGQTRGFPLNHIPCGLGRDIAGSKAGTTGGQYQIQLHLIRPGL